MLVFAYNKDTINENGTIKNVIIHKNEHIETKLNILYYEENESIKITSQNIKEKYLENKNLVIEVNDINLIEKAKKIFDDVESEIEYSIVSRGTEKSGSKGYISITKPINKERYLIVQDHKERFITTYKDSLNCHKYDIYNIAFSRFEIIPTLALSKINYKDNILLCGIGNIGITSLIYMLDKGYKKIDIYANDIKKYIVEIIKKINKKYQSKVKIIKEIKKEYETYVDTTGSDNVLEQIFKDIKLNKIVFLIGTPRENKYKIEPLLIHRNNLIIVGGHELRGISKEERVEIFEKNLKRNKKNDLIKEIVNINNYKENILEQLLREKNHFIEVIKYDNRN